jgi:hypothetical protein
MEERYVSGGRRIVVPDPNVGRSYPAPDTLGLHPLDATGDEFAGSALGAAWTQRNLAGGHVAFPVADPAVRLTLDAQGDGIWRPAPSGDFELVGSFRFLASKLTASNDATMLPHAAMVGLGIVDSSGTGVGCSWYYNGRGFFIWNLTTYNYASSGPTIAMDPPSAAYWLSLKKSGTNYTGRYSLDGSSWSSFTSAQSSAHTVAQIGIGRFFTLGGGDVTVEVSRFNVYPSPGFYS